MEKIIKRKKLQFANYIMETKNNHFILTGIRFNGYNEYDHISDKELYDDLYKLGETIYLSIEEKEDYKSVFKEKKDLKIINTNHKYNSFDYNLDMNEEKKLYLFNYPIEILDYTSLFNNIKISESIINFINKYGIPYFPDIDETDIHEGIETMIEEQKKRNVTYPINIDPLVYTSVTIYTLKIIEKILELKTLNYYEKNIKQFFDLKLENDYSIEEYKKHLNDLKNIFYKNKSSIFNNIITSYYDYINNNKHIIETDNIVLAGIEHFKNDNYHRCKKCNSLSLNIFRGLCKECYDEEPYYVKNEQRKKNYHHANEIIQSLLKSGIPDMNNIIKQKCKNYKDGKIKDPNKEEIKELEKLYNTYIKE